MLNRTMRKLCNEPRFIEMFLNEAQGTAKRSQPNVAPSVTALEEGDRLSLRPSTERML